MKESENDFYKLIKLSEDEIKLLSKNSINNDNSKVSKIKNISVKNINCIIDAIKNINSIKISKKSDDNINHHIDIIINFYSNMSLKFKKKKEFITI